ERAEQRAAGVGLDRLRLVLVDEDLHLAAGDEPVARDEQQAHQRQDDAGEHADTYCNRQYHWRILNQSPGLKPRCSNGMEPGVAVTGARGRSYWSPGSSDPGSSQLNAHEGHEPDGHQPRDDERYAEAAQAVRYGE